jgi:hypothetical protein
MKVLKIVIPVIIVIVLVFGGYKLIKLKKEMDLKEKTATLYPIVVQTYKPQYKEVILTLPAVAEVKNSKEVAVATKFPGKILFIKNLGEKVKKGDLIVKIDDSELKSQLNTVNSKIASLKDKISAEKISLNNLIKTHIRTKKLLEVKMASIEQYQNEESKIASLKAAIKADENTLKSLYSQKQSVSDNLKYTTVYANTSGIVSAKLFNKGDIAPMLKPILKITPESGNYLLVLLPKKEKAIIYNDKEYPLIPLKSTFNGIQAYKAEVDDKTLLPGEKVNVKVVTFQGKGTFLPFNTILTIENKNYIFTPKPKEVSIVASGVEGAVIQEKLDIPVIKAEPDILLKIKAGYPVKVKNKG